MMAKTVLLRGGDCVREGMWPTSDGYHGQEEEERKATHDSRGKENATEERRNRRKRRGMDGVEQGKDERNVSGEGSGRPRECDSGQGGGGQIPLAPPPCSMDCLGDCEPLTVSLAFGIS